MDFYVRKPSSAQAAGEWVVRLLKQVNWQHTDGEQRVYKISVEQAEDPRSLPQNKLYWKWMGAMAEHFSRGNKAFSKDDMHDLMRHKFLGYEEKTIGSTAVNKMRSTRRLSVGEFGRYMEQIDAWAADHGVLLPTPGHSAHEEYLKKNK